MKDQILFVDTETTGIEDTDRLCQVAYKIRGIDFPRCALFKPPVPISIEAMSITHITNEDVAKLGSFKDHVWNVVMKGFFVNKSYVTVAHNAEYDLEMFKREGLPRPARHICTLKVAHHHDSKGELGKHNLQYLRYYYGLKLAGTINPHDALSDVFVLEKLFEYYLSFYTVEEMEKISSRPILLKKFMFGKHKDEWFKDVVVKDREYLEWMWREMKMDENMKYTVSYYLKGHHSVEWGEV